MEERLRLLRLNIVTVICLFSAFTFAARPWGDIQLFPPNRIPDGGQDPQRKVVRDKIVQYHNFFRTKVRPTASNMLKMSWNKLAAQQAQEYAERCVFLQHNANRERAVPHLGECGQNIFVSTDKSPWFFALKSWFLEYKNFTYGSPAVDLHAVGHYTQMVWATSSQVGCGLAHCRGGPWGHFYNYVCHYCPGGNIDSITQYPYKAGKPCAACPGSCVSGSMCTNSCPLSDLYNNCQELLQYDALQFCEQGSCNATCSCGDEKIYRNYPW